MICKVCQNETSEENILLHIADSVCIPCWRITQKEKGTYLLDTEEKLIEFSMKLAKPIDYDKLSANIADLYASGRNLRSMFNDLGR